MKIEQGCTAIIVKGAQAPGLETNIGKIVRVGKFIGNKPGLQENLWEVDQLMTLISGKKVPFAPEEIMERIDDDSIDEESEISKELKLERR